MKKKLAAIVLSVAMINGLAAVPAFAAETETETETETAAAESEKETKDADGEDTELETDENGKTIYVIEAEQTNLESKYGSGYSGSTTGTGMVLADDTDSKSASNGYYVGWLYYNGAYLSFEFEAEEDIDDLDITFRLSAQYNSVEAEDDDIYVGINYDNDLKDYEQKFDFPLSIESYSEFSSNVMDFQDYLVVENVSVKKGLNTVELMINNDTKGVGGTMKAAAPLVDCVYLSTTGTITPITYNAEFGGAEEE